MSDCDPWFVSDRNPDIFKPIAVLGMLSAASTLIPLIDMYKPKCIAMAGVCAGRPGKTNLGDVVAAERLFVHDAGKQYEEHVLQDLKTYNLRDDWKIAIERFDFASRFHDQQWWKDRPILLEWQENWLLEQLLIGTRDPASHPECHRKCAQWTTVVEGLWESGDLENGALKLSQKGEARIKRVLIKHRNTLPDVAPSGELLPFKVHVAPFGSGNKIIEDSRVWSFVSEYMRLTLGIEMEAAALGAIANSLRRHKMDALVMKGVMDFGNAGRDDRFKEYAAHASAEALIAFLLEEFAG